MIHNWKMTSKSFSMAGTALLPAWVLVLESQEGFFYLTAQTPAMLQMTELSMNSAESASKQRLFLPHLSSDWLTLFCRTLLEIARKRQPEMLKGFSAIPPSVHFGQFVFCFHSKHRQQFSQML
jgi:hypothetical protein